MQNIQENEITLKSSVNLRGKLTIPNNIESKNVPAIMIIAGSGPLDADGNGPKGKYQFNLYKDLAHYLSELGFITLRYDKRGTGQSDGEWVSTGMWDLVDDAEIAYNYLVNNSRVDPTKVIVAGHSEGGIIATALSQRCDLAGIMFLSVGVDNIEESLRFQRKGAYEELKKQTGLKGWLCRKINIEKKGEKSAGKLIAKALNTDKNVIRYNFVKINAKWYREHFTFNMRESLKNVTCPTFTIVGDKDPLIVTSTLKELKDLVKGNCKYYIIENMEHGLKEQIEPKSILKLKKFMKDGYAYKPIHHEAKDRIKTWLSFYN